jgi:hypothetical protein
MHPCIRRFSIVLSAAVLALVVGCASPTPKPTAVPVVVANCGPCFTPPAALPIRYATPAPTALGIVPNRNPITDLRPLDTPKP